MSKLFSHAGVSKHNGEFKVRYANDALRTKVLVKNGHTDIDILELTGGPMTKEDAVAFLMKIELYKDKNGVVNAEVQAALEAEISKRSDVKSGSKDRPKKEAKKPKQPKKPTMEGIVAKVEAKKAAPKSTVTRAEIEAQLKDIEDAPF